MGEISYDDLLKLQDFLDEQPQPDGRWILHPSYYAIPPIRSKRKRIIRKRIGKFGLAVLRKLPGMVARQPRHIKRAINAY